MICETQDCGSEAVTDLLVCGCFMKVCEVCRAHMWHASTQRDEVSADLEGFDRG